MAKPSRALAEANDLTRTIRFELGREIRSARLSAGISLRTAAKRVGMSHTQLRRIELGEVLKLQVDHLSRGCASVGLKLFVRAMPGTGVALDSGQLAALGRLRARLPDHVPMPTEVPLPGAGDPRAWDAVLELEPRPVPVEAEARVRDVQALVRRATLKLRDSGFDRMILLIADTAGNRAMLAANREYLRAPFPLDTRAVLRSLRAGKTPDASGIVVL